MVRFGKYHNIEFLILDLRIIWVIIIQTMKTKRRSFFSFMIERKVFLRYPITFMTKRIIGRIFLNGRVKERPRKRSFSSFQLFYRFSNLFFLSYALRHVQFDKISRSFFDECEITAGYRETENIDYFRIGINMFMIYWLSGLKNMFAKGNANRNNVQSFFKKG